MRRAISVIGVVLVLVLAALSGSSDKDPKMKNAFRRPENNGWTFIHLQGSPWQIGYQHGYLLAPEIEDTLNAVKVETVHDNQKDWEFFRNAAAQMMWPHIDQEYRDEMQGIVDGATAHGAKLDIWDIVALNGSLEWSYYVKQYNKDHGIKSTASLAAPEHCSAFVATGSYTKDGRVIIAHNNWSNYIDGERWTIVFDIVPEKGKRFMMDGLPGVIHSADDFGVNAAGIAITETTISGFSGYDPSRIPEFVRARRAMQYATSIDEFARLMAMGNNGGYANDWLVVDTKTNEIASLVLGLRNVTLERKKDGYFVGSNFPINAKLTKDETDFDVKDMSLSANARHVRWNELMEQNKGKIDVAAAQKFLADHYDTYEKKEQANERTLCGHYDLSPRTSSWQPPYGPAGAVQNKAADATMISKMTFTAAAGHACGMSFKAAEHLKAHPELDWQKPVLRDMNAYPWATFTAAK